MLKLACGVPNLPRRGVNRVWRATPDQPLHPDLPVNSFSVPLVIKHAQRLVDSSKGVLRQEQIENVVQASHESCKIHV